MAVMVVDVHVVKDRSHRETEAYQKALRTINQERGGIPQSEAMPLVSSARGRSSPPSI